jgi:hypothetical protein
VQFYRRETQSFSALSVPLYGVPSAVDAQILRTMDTFDSGGWDLRRSEVDGEMDQPYGKEVRG